MRMPRFWDQTKILGHARMVQRKAFTLRFVRRKRAARNHGGTLFQILSKTSTPSWTFFKTLSISPWSLQLAPVLTSYQPPCNPWGYQTSNPAYKYPPQIRSECPNFPFPVRVCCSYLGFQDPPQLSHTQNPRIRNKWFCSQSTIRAWSRRVYIQLLHCFLCLNMASRLLIIYSHQWLLDRHEEMLGVYYRFLFS